MKKMFAVLFMVFMLFAACGDEPTSVNLTGDNMDLVTPNLQTLMTNGDQIVEDTVEGYTDITNQDMKDLIKAYADITIFPVDGASGYTLQDRLKAYLGGDNNLMNSYLIQQNYMDGKSLTDGIGTLPPAAHARGWKKFLGKALVFAAPLADSLFPGASVLCAGVGKGLQKMESQEKKAKAEAQLAAYQKTVTDFIADARTQFKNLNTKMDTSIGLLKTILGDINNMDSLVQHILDARGMDAVKISYASFLDNYNSSSPTTVSNIVYSYYLTSGQFFTDLNTFIYCATNIQEWNVTNAASSGYNDWISQDTGTSVNYKMVYMKTFEIGSYWTGKYDFPNPKTRVMISLGDLDYLSKMMITRMEMNQLMYSGTTLMENNSVLADVLLGKLVGIKQAAMTAFKAMRDRLNNYKTMKMGYDGSYYFISNISNEKIFSTSNYPHWQDYAESFECGWVYNNGGTYESTYNITGIDAVGNKINLLMIPNLLPLIDSSYETALQEYMAHYLARLVALEVMLKSYK